MLIAQTLSVVPYQDLPIYPDRERAFKRDEAVGRVRRWASSDGSGDKSTIDWAKFRRAFVWYDGEDPEHFGSHKGPIADVIDGKLYAIARGVEALAGVLDGARGGIDIPESDVEGVKGVVEKYYAKMREAFDDDEIKAPWAKSAQRSGMRQRSLGLKSESLRSAIVVAKSAAASARPDPFTPSDSEVEAINKLTLRDFTAPELWVCTVRACDNQPDRHFDRLLVPALQQLGKTFVGRPGLGDHLWSMKTQNCRIFDSFVATDAGEPSDVKGEPYTYLGLQVYMPRTDENASFRCSIESGITKESSVGFFLDYMAEICSICGEPLWKPDSKCAHMPGREYDGDTCLALIPAHEGLEGAENSWVAVPAQPRAGAIRAQKDTDGDDQRRELLERKEKAVQAKQLIELLGNPQALAKALEGEDAATVAALVGKLSTTTGAVVAPLEAPPAQPSALPEATKKAVDDAVKAALAPEAIAGIVKATLDGQQKQIDELRATLASKLAPANGSPLVTGFGDNAQASGNAPNAAPGSLAASLVPSLLGA